MIFLALALITIVSVIVAFKKDSGAWYVGAMASFVSSVALLMVILCGGMFGIPAETVVQEKLKLSSVTTPDGNFYATTTNNNKLGRVVNFTVLKEENGQEWNEIRSVSGANIKIFTNENEQPYYLSEKKIDRTFILVPWIQDILRSQQDSFYIPKDSIIENYEIK